MDFGDAKYRENIYVEFGALFCNWGMAFTRKIVNAYNRLLKKAEMQMQIHMDLVVLWAVMCAFCFIRNKTNFVFFCQILKKFGAKNTKIS